MEEATARTERKDQENCELMQKLFLTLQTTTPVIVNRIVATLSTLTDDSKINRKRPKTGEELTAMSSQMEDSTTSTDTIPGLSAESLSDNYNPGNSSPCIAQHHNVWKCMNRPKIE